MKYKPVLFACCLLVLGGFNAAAQEITAPPAPPQDSASALPDPGRGPAQSGGSSRGRAQAPAPAVPAQSDGSASRGRAQAPAPAVPAQSGGAASRGRAQAPARADQPASDTSGTVIPSKGLFIGAMAGYNDNTYGGSDLPSGMEEQGGFTGGFLLGYDFGLLAGQVELLFVTENSKYEYITYYSSIREDYSAVVMQIPLMLKLDLHWWRIMVQPQAGFYLNVPLGDLNVKTEETYWGGTNNWEESWKYSPSTFGYMFGAAFGFRIGKGYLFMDVRYVADAGETETERPSYGTQKMERSATTVSLGYQYYFGSGQ